MLLTFRTLIMNTKNNNTESKTTESKTTESMTTGSKTTESVKTESVKAGSVKTESVKVESVATGSVKTESVKTESVATGSEKAGSKKIKKAKNIKNTKKAKNTKNTKKTKKTDKTKKIKKDNTESNNIKKWSIYNKSDINAELTLGQASIQELVIALKFASIQKKKDWGNLIEYKKKWREILKPFFVTLEQLYKQLETLEGKDKNMLEYVLCGAFSWKYQRTKLWKAVNIDIYRISDTLCQDLRSVRGYIHNLADGEYQIKLLDEFNDLVDKLGEKSIRTYEYTDRETEESVVGRRLVEDLTQQLRQVVQDVKEEQKIKEDKKE